MTALPSAPRLPRGTLPAEEPGARGLEHMARNRECLRLAALTLAGVNPATASAQVYGHPVREGLSPFAIRRGERFEAALFADDCARLVELYRRAGRLGAAPPAWLDLSAAHPGGTPEALQARQRASEQLIVRRARGDLTTPALLIKPRLAVPLLDAERPTEPDALVAGPEERGYRVVEIKSYADRRALTDAVKTGSACRQAAVGQLALAALLAQHELAAPAPLVDLVFARPGSNWPTLTVMHVADELDNLQAALEGSPAAAEAALAVLDGRALDDPAALDALPNRPCAGCADHCPLWERCRGQLIASGSPQLLGDGAAELLIGLHSLQQAAALRDAGGSADPQLDLLGQLLAEADSAYRQSWEEVAE